MSGRLGLRLNCCRRAAGARWGLSGAAAPAEIAPPPPVNLCARVSPLQVEAYEEWVANKGKVPEVRAREGVRCIVRCDAL